MYQLKPIITRNETLNRDSCMYEMKNIHGVRGDHACKENKIVADIAKQTPLPDVAILEARQEKILAQLAELKEQVLSLCDVLKVTEQTGETSSTGIERRNPVSVEIVVKANPTKPCYAVQALARLWKDVDFGVTCYKHSDVLGDVPEIKIARKPSFKDSVKLSLIWKSVEDLEIVIPGSHGYPLIGETNLLRYLFRQLFSTANDKSLTSESLSSLDVIFDLSHRLNYQESPKDVQSTLSQFGEKLGKKNWLSIGDKAGLADTAAWSAIKRASLAKLPSNLAAWFDRCNECFL